MKLSKQNIHLTLIDYYNTKQLILDRNERKTINVRKVAELPWQLSKAESWLNLANLLADPTWLSILSQYNVLDLKHYWSMIEDNSKLKMPDVYSESIRNPIVNDEYSLIISDLLDETRYPNEAIQILESLSDYYDTVNNNESFVATKMRLGMIFKNQGNYNDALKAFKQCAKVIRNNEVVEALPSLLLNMATVEVNVGTLNEALSNASQAEDLFKKYGQKQGLCRSLTLKAQIMFSQGNISEATHNLNEAYSVAKSMSSDLEIMDIKATEVKIFYDQGKLLEAKSKLTDIEPYYVKTGDLSNLARICVFKGLIHKAQGEYKEALKAQEAAASLYRRLGYNVFLAGSIGNQAEILIRLNKLHKAKQLNDESIEIFRKYGNEQELAISLVNKGIIEIFLDEIVEAEQSFTDSLVITNKLVDYKNMGHALCGLARVREKHERFLESIELLDKAIESFERVNALEGICSALLSRAHIKFAFLNAREGSLVDLERVIDLSIEMGFKPALDKSLAFIALNYRLKSELNFALAATNEWQNLVLESGSKQRLALVHVTKSEILYDLEKYSEAQNESILAYDLANEVSDQELIGHSLFTMTLCLRIDENFDEALLKIDEAMAKFRLNNNWQMVIECLILRSQIQLFDLQDKNSAIMDLKYALEILKENEDNDLKKKIDNLIRYCY